MQQQQHYYNVGPRPFPSHGIPPSQGSFGSPPPPPLPPPPRPPPPQTVSALVSSVQSPSQGAGHFMSSNVGNGPIYNRCPSGIARSDNESGLSKPDVGISVIEKVILQLQKEKENKVDVGRVLFQIRALVGQAEDALQKVGKMFMLEPSISEPNLVTCPYNFTHRLSPEALFKHSLCCSSNPKPKVDAEKLISSLRYPRLQSRGEDSEPETEDQRTLQSQNLSLSDAGNPNSLVLHGGNTTKGGRKLEMDNLKHHSPTLRSRSADVSPTLFSDEIDIWGGSFLYKDSPAVVQAPLPTPHPASEVSKPQVALTHPVDKVILELDVSSAESLSLMGGIGSLSKEDLCGDDVGPLLSSRLWFLQREIEMWKELPTRCSTLVLHVATGVWRIRRKAVSDWILLQGPAHGIVIDPAMASHIYSLAKICLKALPKEASVLIDHGSEIIRRKGSPPMFEKDGSMGPKFDLATRPVTEDQKWQGDDTSGLVKVKEEPTLVMAEKDWSLKVSLLDCPHLFQSGHWLASQLSSLFGPFQSKLFVLKLFKHFLVLSGCILASSFVDSFTTKASESCWQLGSRNPNEVRDLKLLEEFQTPEHVKEINSKPVKSKVETVEKGRLPLEVETAMAAVRERAILESYLRNLTYPSLSSRLQMLQQHEATVTMAATERRTRANYRPVLEHDGLIWHRSQLEEKNKNKTREEILAEERDYKRRRMSYRGKKLKRNPTEVLHDLIGGHMDEIVEAGGIGCFVKHTGGILASAEAGRVDNSRTSSLVSTNDTSLVSTNDTMNPNQSDDFFPRASTSYPKNSGEKDKKGSWHDHSRDSPVWGDDRSKEQIRSRTFKHDLDYTGTDSSSNRYSEMEDEGTHDENKGEDKYRSDGSLGRFHRHKSYHSSDSGKDNGSFHSRSGKDDGSDPKNRRVDSSVGHSRKDHRRDRSQSQRQSESREASNEDNDYEKRRSREYSGKSKSSY